MKKLQITNYKVNSACELFSLTECEYKRILMFLCVLQDEEERHEQTSEQRRRSPDPAPRRIDFCYLLRRNPGPFDPVGA